MSNETEQFWEQFYREGRGRWSGRPNRSLVDETGGLEPGRALDLGAGKGADAIWLAARGWAVTAVDVSSVALAEAERAASAELDAAAAARIAWVRRDLADGLPSGSWDLVTASFLHSPVELPRSGILRAAAAAVAPGGTLLVVGHAPSDSHPHADLPGLEEVRDELALPADAWQLVTCELRAHEHAFAEEEAHVRVDAVLRWTRR